MINNLKFSRVYDTSQKMAENQDKQVHYPNRQVT